METNNRIEWIWEIYLKYVFVLVGVMLAGSSAASVILCRLIRGDFDIEYFYYPMKVRLETLIESTDL